MKKAQNTDSALKKHLLSFSPERADALILENSLSLIVENNTSGCASIKTSNIILDKMHFCELCRLNNLMDAAGIEMILFKGRVLAEQLYEESWKRLVGDIDIYVSLAQYDKATHLLINDGYHIDTETYQDIHHMVFAKGIYCVELHHHIIAPQYGLSQGYLEGHTRLLQLPNGQMIRTFDKTATVLHLMYHLYMDSNTISNLYEIFKNSIFSQPTRFLYRAYELARFVEIYYDEINWNELIDDIRAQSFNRCFEEMIRDVANMFPNIFPVDFLKMIYSKNYRVTYNDMLKRDLSLMSKKYNGFTFKEKLGQYIEQKHLEEGGIEVYAQQNADTFIVEDNNCTLKARIWKACEWHFQIQAIQPGLVTSALDKFDSLKSDGIHMIICTTNPYEYLSVFFFPKMIENSLKVLAFDDNTKTIYPDDAFVARFAKNENGYLLDLLISKTAFPSIYKNKHFYCNLIMSVCNPITKRREQCISRVQDSRKWFVPTAFVKIKDEN